MAKLKGRCPKCGYAYKKGHCKFCMLTKGRKRA